MWNLPFDFSFLAMKDALPEWRHALCQDRCFMSKRHGYAACTEDCSMNPQKTDSPPKPKYLCDRCGTGAGVHVAPRFAGICKECGLDLSKVAVLDCRHRSCPAYTDNSLVSAKHG